jgi:hypothetical protein
MAARAKPKDPWAGTWTAQECAEHWGVEMSTWRDYVSRDYAPQPLPGFDDQRRRRWDPAAVRKAFDERPGRGARTDITRAKQGQAATAARSKASTEAS